MKIFLYLGLGLVVCFFTVTPAAAQIQPTISYEYYTVPYIKGASLAKMVSEATPLKMANGRKARGMAYWKIIRKKPVFSHPSIGVCRLEKPNIAGSCRIVLPKLEGGDAKTRDQFAALVEKVKIHELVHCRIAAEYTNIVADAFMALKDQKCEDMTKAMTAIYKKNISDCKIAQTRFDYVEYGYKHYLNAELFGQMSDAELMMQRTPPSAKKKQAAKQPQPAKPSSDQVAAVTEKTEEQEEQVIYRDKNGVWRNY